MEERERIKCPRCGKEIAVLKEWAPGYPVLYKHKDWSRKHCYDGYLRQRKDGSGEWCTG